MFSRTLLASASVRSVSRTPRPSRHPLGPPPPWTPRARHFAAPSQADEKIEELQELYATAKDEFEIAVEETEKKSVYARDDRAAAREELEKLKEAYSDAVKAESGVSAEIKSRVGQRVRELENAVEELNKADFED